MSDSNISQNLSETLFKPKFDYAETSTISNSACPLPTLSRRDPYFGFEENFYRPILKFTWVHTGGNAIDIDEALARICTSKNERTRSSLYDTVKDYGPGHWVYEFNCEAQERVNAAKEALEKNDLKKASHNYRMAARYYSIAAYPYLKGDVFAQEADTLARTYYKKIFDIEDSEGDLLEQTFDVDGKKVKGYLHLPNLTDVHACVIAVCPYENAFSSYYRLYADYLKPYNIACFVLEMPGVGGCEKLNLNDHFSLGVEKAIDHLATLKYVDSNKIGLLGIGMAGTACIRATILNSSKVKGLFCFAPFVHSFYTDADILNSLPLCVRSSLCNRLDLDASSWDTVIPRFKAYSLKTQGILSASGRCTVPTTVCSVENSVITKEDLRSLGNNFKDFTSYVLENNHSSMFLKASLEKVSTFFDKIFNS